MRKFLKFYLIILGLVITVASTAPANYCFSPFDVPGAFFSTPNPNKPIPSSTGITGINDSGSIVGYYENAAGTHGFLYAGGSFISINDPDAIDTYFFGVNTSAFGINDSGSIVGYYIGAGGTHGFLYAGESFTSINVPGATRTYAFGINDSASIAGYYEDAAGAHGFLYAGGSFTSINAPGASDTWAFGINDSGNIAGYYEDAAGAHGFLYAGGSFTSINAPGASDTWAFGINDSGSIVGYYIDGAGGHGFLYAGGSFTSINFPGASDTWAFGVNDSGNIVGIYSDAIGAGHGFMATSPTISPVSQSFSRSGGAGSVNVTAPSGCSWTATSNTSWITITSGGSGGGNGAVTYLVAANTSTSQRTGTMTIASQPFTVTQAGSTTPPSGGPPKISVSPTSVNFGNVNLGSTSQKIVTIQNKGKSDLVISSINISGANASDFSQTNNCTTIPVGKLCTITVTFAPTSKGKKSGIMSISSNDPKKPTVNVKLSGNAKSSACTYSISPSSQQFDASGGTGSVNVTGPNGCNWTATSNASWITITSNSSSSGNGTVNYAVAANTNTSQRTGTMTIAGKTFTVTQSGSPSPPPTCTYTLSSTNKSFGSTGGSDSITVATQTGCNWSAKSNNSDWITITSGTTFSGTGTVTYTVAANTSASSRTGTMTIAGQTFTVTQWPPSALCTYIYSAWSACQPNNTQTRTVISSSPPGCVGTPVLTQPCTYVPPTCNYTYSAWSACQPNNTQTRTVISSSPPGCVGTPVLTQPCTYVPPTCTYTYSAWSACQPNNTQTRTVISSSPAGCVGTPILSRPCTYVPPTTGDISGTWVGTYSESPVYAFYQCSNIQSFTDTGIVTFVISQSAGLTPYDYRLSGTVSMYGRHALSVPCGHTPCETCALVPYSTISVSILDQMSMWSPLTGLLIQTTNPPTVENASMGDSFIGTLSGNTITGTLNGNIGTFSVTKQ